MVISTFAVAEATAPQKPQFDTHFCTASMKSMCLLNGSVIVWNKWIPEISIVQNKIYIQKHPIEAQTHKSGFLIFRKKLIFWPGALSRDFYFTCSVLFSVICGLVFSSRALTCSLSNLELLLNFSALVDPTDALQFLKTTWCNLSPPIVDETGFCDVTIVSSRKEISGKLKSRFMVYLERWLFFLYRYFLKWNKRGVR